MEEKQELNQINLSIIGVVIFIFILFHSIYLLNEQKKEVLHEESISDKEFITQRLINRIIAGVIIFMFFYFAYRNYQSKENKTFDDLLQLSVSTFTLIAISIEIYITYKAYLNTLENENKPSNR